MCVREREIDRESRGGERKGENISHTLLLECTTVCCGVVDREVECLIKHITTNDEITSYKNRTKQKTKTRNLQRYYGNVYMRC